MTMAMTMTMIMTMIMTITINLFLLITKHISRPAVRETAARGMLTQIQRQCVSRLTELSYVCRINM